MKVVKRYCKAHENCPYYDRDKQTCVRNGCIFIYPCSASNNADNPFRKGQ